MRITVTFAIAVVMLGAAHAADLAGEVNPFIGTTNGGNTYPGATLPFGMVAFSPEETPLPGRNYPIAAPGGYEWRANGIRGFSLTHLSGTGCTGASGDIPIMPVTKAVELSPSADDSFAMYSSLFSHSDEEASPGWYKVALANGVTVELSATLRTGYQRFAWPKDKPANLLFRTSDSEVGSSDAFREGRSGKARGHRLGHQRKFLRLSLTRPARKLLHALLRRRTRPAVHARWRLAGPDAHARRTRGAWRHDLWRPRSSARTEGLGRVDRVRSGKDTRGEHAHRHLLCEPRQCAHQSCGRKRHRHDARTGARCGAQRVEHQARTNRSERRHEERARRLLHRALSCSAGTKPVQRRRRFLSRIRQNDSQSRAAAARAICEFLGLGRLSLAVAARDLARSKDSAPTSRNRCSTRPTRTTACGIAGRMRPARPA